VTKKERAEIWRWRIRRLSEARKRFFDGESDSEGRVVRPGANFAIEAFRGNTKPSWWNDKDLWVHIGKVKSSIRANLPALLYSNPEFQVTPSALQMAASGEEAYATAKAQALWLNHVYREANGNAHVRVAIQNSFLAYGVIKSGYRCQFQDDSKRGVFAQDEDGNYLLDENGDPTLERGEFLLDENGDIARDSYGIPVLHPGSTCKEEWVVEVIDPQMMLFDVESGPDFKHHRFVIEEWVRPLEAVKDDPRFAKARRDRLVATEGAYGVGQRKSEIFGIGSGLKDTTDAVESDESRVRGWDIYDFENGRFMVLPDCGDEEDEFLFDGPMPAGMEHGPYSFLKLTEDVGAEWYPIPDAIDMARVAQEYDITRSEMMIHREHTKTRYLEMPNAYDGHPGVDPEEEREKWATGEDAVAIRVNGPNAILPAPKAQLDSSFMSAIPNIAADFNEVAGLPGEARGIADAETATQASILATGSEVRNNDRRDNLVQAFLCDIGRKLLMSGQANVDLDSYVIERVSASTGAAPFKSVKISPVELAGEFDVSISVGSTLPKNDPRVLNSLMNLLNALAQNPALGQFKGLIRRVIDGLGLDPFLAEEIYEVSVGLTQQAAGSAGSPEGPPSDVGQVLGSLLGGGVGNAAGGAQTGAPANGGRGYQ